MEEWAKDCKIDQTELMHTMYSLPMLHSKYLTHHQNYKVALRKFTLKYQSLRLIQQKYFNGEFTKEQLDQHGWLQYQFKRPLRAEMEALLDASPDLQELEERSLYV